MCILAIKKVDFIIKLYGQFKDQWRVVEYFEFSIIHQRLGSSTEERKVTSI